MDRAGGEQPAVLPSVAQGRLLPFGATRRVVVFGERSLAAAIFDLDGRPVGSLRAGRSRQAMMVPFIRGDHVLYLGGPAGAPSAEALVGRLPLAGGARYMQRYALPAPVPIRADGGHPSLFRADSPLAVLCGPGQVLLRTTQGWAALQVEDHRSPAPPRRARRVRGSPPAWCPPLRQLDHSPFVPANTTIHSEVTLGGRLFTLGGPRVPPPYLVLLGARREKIRVVQPPPSTPVWGAALTAGRWVLFHGRSCEQGELRLTLSDLLDARGRPNLWSRLLPVDRFQGCTAAGGIAARICPTDATLLIERRGRASAVDITSGADRPLPDAAARSECLRLEPMDRMVPAWRGGRTLQIGRDTYQLTRPPRFVEARRGGARRWRRPVAGPGYLLGATERDLLVVSSPDSLIAMNRATGEQRLVQRIPELFDDIEGQLSPCQWIGHVGRRGYWLIAGSQDWIISLDRVTLAVFDGARVVLR